MLAMATSVISKTPSLMESFLVGCCNTLLEPVFLITIILAERIQHLNK